jgi:hypothetical protein
MIAILAGLGLGVLGALGTWPLALHGRIGLQILASGCPRKSSYQGCRALHLVDEVDPVGLANEFRATRSTECEASLRAVRASARGVCGAHGNIERRRP